MFVQFFEKHGFVLEFLICTAMFVLFLKRRRMFVLRLVCCAAAAFGFSLLWALIPEVTALTENLKCIILFVLLLAGVLVCFKTVFWMALFCMTGACATQHAAFKIGDTAVTLLGSRLEGGVLTLLYCLAVAAVYLASYLVFARKLKKNESSYLENKSVTVLSITLVMIAIIFATIFERSSGNLSLSLYLIFSFYDLICCVFTLCIQYDMFRSGKLKEDYDIVEHMMFLQKEQFEQSRENIDLINVKCHDLKKQIALLKGRITPEEISELSRAISIYDGSVKTGNEVLDIILAEKSLLCEREHIKLDCMADGNCLSFLTASDIYSIFGNALDNAVEAVQKIDDLNRRLISLRVKEALGMVSIHIENCYNGTLSFIEGMPLTTKTDKQFHGYGIKSIRMLTEKYRGYFSVRAEDGVFNLNILIPQPQKR